ncbi:MAG: response regulator [Bacteroidetes bacterium]|nr:response regulator [Bacteroidota bacterium]
MKFGKARKIFIVEDDELQSSLLMDRLTRDIPHTVTIFPTGEECLKHIHENPEIIILDYHLNKDVKDAATGMEILTVIKKANPDIHIIMLSSQERYSIALQSIQKGAEQYVVKDATAFEKINNLVNDLK